jgi:hypothetical protein
MKRVVRGNKPSSRPHQIDGLTSIKLQLVRGELLEKLVTGAGQPGRVGQIGDFPAFRQLLRHAMSSCISTSRLIIPIGDYRVIGMVLLHGLLLENMNSMHAAPKHQKRKAIHSAK